jgi:phosphatidylinositol alpha-1,6-mannosyltransferase
VEGAPAVDVPRVLVVTNDFPPRVGGVQQYLWNLVRTFPADRVAVLAPNWPNWREHDGAQPFPVHRWPATFLWPTRDLALRVRALVAERGADVVLFGHGFPLPMLAPDLRERRVPSVILTHGAEVWLARSPVLSSAMRRGFAAAREVTAVSNYTARALRRLVPNEVAFSILPPAVDPERFSPSADGSPVRSRYGLHDEKVILCVSRLVPRKGQDVLIGAMSLVRELVPDAALLIVGDGPDRGRLEGSAREAPPGSVLFAGQVPDADLPAHYASCDLFAMPCRSRWGGLEVEGFGIVFLEAAAASKAAVCGRSGGAEEAVADQVTGLLVEGSEPKAVALAVSRLLRDPDLMGRMGTAGRRRVEDGFTWDVRARQLAEILSRAVA